MRLTLVKVGSLFSCQACLPCTVLLLLGGFQPAGHLVAGSLCSDMEMPSEYRGPCARQTYHDFVLIPISFVLLFYKNLRYPMRHL